jgi:hypothetical protein
MPNFLISFEIKCFLWSILVRYTGEKSMFSFLSIIVTFGPREGRRGRRGGQWEQESG